MRPPTSRAENATSLAFFGLERYRLGMSFRRLFRVTCATVLAASLWGACAASVPPQNDDDQGTGGVAGTGGVGGEAGAGGSSLPCGIDCSTIATGNSCKQSKCDEVSGNCSIVDSEDGTACDDEQFCTTNDACSAGSCLGGPPNDCGMSVPQCQLVVCNELTTACSVVPASDGTGCPSDNPCLINSQCSNGLCIGQEKDCFFAPVPNECFVATCNPANGLCEPEAGNDGNLCTDPSDLCTVEKTCSSGACVGGNPKDCASLNQGCNAGLCNPGSGVCEPIPIPDGAVCDDHNGCTTGEICTTGMCGGGAVTMQCVDADQCCAQGCDETNDSDCVLKILLLGESVQDTLQLPNWQTYRDALQNAGVLWTERNLNNQPFPTQTELDAFNTVILFDESSVTFGDPQCQILATWLSSQSGRNMFVTGRDILWDFASSQINQGENNLYTLWGMTYMGSSFITSNDGRINGVMGDPISNDFVLPNGLDLGTGGKSGGDYANKTLGPASHIGVFAGTTGFGLGESAMTRYTASGYKVVWLGVNFHNGLSQQSQRNTLMSNVLTFFTN
jgi:hypothetical protein